jgi:hypothetical protein
MRNLLETMCEHQPEGEDAGRHCDREPLSPRSTTARAVGLTDVLLSKGSTSLRWTARQCEMTRRTCREICPRRPPAELVNPVTPSAVMNTPASSPATASSTGQCLVR